MKFGTRQNMQIIDSARLWLPARLDRLLQGVRLGVFALFLGLFGLATAMVGPAAAQSYSFSAVTDRRQHPR